MTSKCNKCLCELALNEHNFYKYNEKYRSYICKICKIKNTKRSVNHTQQARDSKRRISEKKRLLNQNLEKSLESLEELDPNSSFSKLSSNSNLQSAISK